MSIYLPGDLLPNTAVPELVSVGGVLSPLGGGGVDQRLNRLGDRHQIAVTMPTRISGPILSPLLAALKKGLTQGAMMRFYQPGIDIGSPGSPVVDGAGQLGSALRLRGMVPGYAIRVDQFFSIIHNGRRYLHSSAEAAIVDTSGRALLPITPMLRIQPANGALCEFAEPKIEGFLSGNSVAWTLTRARTAPPTFIIREAE